tara:strand:+ start:810 stop:938 length:129 start_codon:yes stop_codon:yes gene_type:complete
MNNNRIEYDLTWLKKRYKVFRFFKKSVKTGIFIRIPDQGLNE